MTNREFFTARTVGEALAGFRPARRTAVEDVGLTEALHRVPAADVRAPAAMPGFARSTVDGYAVRAADTYGASEGLPSYLDLAGAVRMGAAPTAVVSHGKCVAIPTGAALPDGADAVVMVEYTAETMPGTIEVTRPVAPGSGLVRADEDAAAGDVLVRAGRPLRAPQLGLLAAAGVTSIAVHARPRVAIVSTGDEVVPPETTTLAAGQVRDATASALAGLIRDAGGEAVQVGIVPDDREALEASLRAALADNDLVVVSAGSSVGARDETAGAVAALGEIWCHGLAVKPGKPTLLAECGGVPLLGLPGNPVSSLVSMEQFGRPAILKMLGRTNLARPVVRVRATEPIPNKSGREHYIRAVVTRTADGGYEARSTGEQGSGILTSLTQANAMLIVEETRTLVQPGETVRAIMLDWPEEVF